MGIMTVATITDATWDFTCKACNVVRNALSVVLVGCIAITESAGRARAASELTRMGMHEEAKHLMTSPLDYPKFEGYKPEKRYMKG
jgi:hypothetical protein